MARFATFNLVIMGLEDVNHFDEALRRMTAMHFPKRPASKVRQYLR
ncbi:hypothetical protein L914_14032 [Phytophthora nicotianae]|nr:hypothetical protein L914_14032 [Phytophthora nicotianae]